MPDISQLLIVITSAAYARDGVHSADGYVELTITDLEAVARDAQARRDAPPLYQGGVLSRADQTQVSVSVGSSQLSVPLLVSVRAGDVLTFTLSQVPTGEPADPYLYLLDASGAVVAHDDDSAGDSDARISGYTAPADGTLTVVAITYGAARHGTFRGAENSLLTLTVTNHTLVGDSPAAPLENVLREATLPGVVRADVPPRRHLDVVFEARAGQVMLVDVHEVTTPIAPMTNLYDADGSMVFTEQLDPTEWRDRFDTRWPASSLPTGAFVVPEDGRYTMRVENDVSYSTISLVVTLTTFDTIPVMTEGTNTVPLTKADAGRALVFRVPPEPLHRRVLRLDEPAKRNLWLELSNARTGAQIRRLASSSALQPIHIIDTDMMLLEDMLLLVRLPDPLPNLAPLTVTLERRQLPWLNDGVTTSYMPLDASDWAAFVVAGEAGETLLLHATALPEAPLGFTVWDSEGQYVTGSATHDPSDALELHFTPPATGLYQVEVGVWEPPWASSLGAPTALITLQLARGATGAP